MSDSPSFEVPTLLLTTEQAAEACQISRGKMIEWTHRAGFPVIREGGVVRIPLELLRAWINAEAVGTNASAATAEQISGLALLPPKRRRAAR